MFNTVELDNFGPISRLSWSDLGQINLVLGPNACGKTFLLKALYSSIRTLEEFRRGDDPRNAADILIQKLLWTFQPEKVGDLVTKGAETPLAVRILSDTNVFAYSFGRNTSRHITALENRFPPRSSNSVFLPAKEVLTLHHIILTSREQDKVYGFDDTYLDLARALRIPPSQGRNYPQFAQSRRMLEDILGGRVEFDENVGRWQFKKGNQKYPIGITAEGIKKLAILDTLLGNRYLDTGSVIFIDEPEAALHPKAVSTFLEIIALLAERGMQFFLASHSYFVIKKLFLLARETERPYKVLLWEDDAWISADLRRGMPDNSIIDESIQLYQQEVGLALS